MHQARTLDVGMEVHQDSSAVASVTHDPHAEVVSVGNLATRPCDIAHLSRRLHAQSPHLVLVYEAGPCGEWLDRELTKTGDVWWVVAPAFIPKQPGDRVTTNRRDAITLARLKRSGDRTPVDGPMVPDDAMRDLCRARAETIDARKAAQCRLKALLLRQDIRSTGRAPWSPAHRRWLRAVVCPPPAPPSVCQESVRAVPDHTARLQRFDQAHHEPVPTGRLQPVEEHMV
jgi:transposase